jgi:DNA modification methylase
MVDTLNALKPLCKTDVDINIINGCAENEMANINDDSMDIIFTSPPYFDLEKYATDDKQSFVKYPSYNDWLHNFLFKIILESKRIMKVNGVFLLNVGNARHNKIVDDVDKFVSKEFRVENVLLMHSPSIWHQSTTEPIFVLRRN